MEPIAIHSLPLLPASSGRPQSQHSDDGQNPPQRRHRKDETADDAKNSSQKDPHRSSDGIVGTLIDVEA